MQVIGICRFSYPAIGGFQTVHETIEDRIRYLYQPERLEERFKLFETIALPGLKDQTDQDFALIVVTGDSLPKEALERLHDITSGIPQVHIVARPPRKHRWMMKELLNAARADPDAPCLQFRHNDDDAVSVDFVERLRQTAVDCKDLLENHHTVALDFNRGFTAEMTADGIAAKEEVRPLLGVALGMWVRGGSPLTIMNFGHHKIAGFMPVISQTDAPMWVRTQNRFNDSQARRGASADLEPLTPELAAEFEARFAINANQVREAFSEDSRSF